LIIKKILYNLKIQNNHVRISNNLIIREMEKRVNHDVII